MSAALILLPLSLLSCGEDMGYSSLVYEDIPDRFTALSLDEAPAPARKRAMAEAAMDDREEAPGEGGGEAPVATRSWFPETFLWAPRVITDARGRASVPVTLPDSLTTWRILGLAGSRAGAQAGAVAQVDTRLPLYVEPRLPPFLRQGDQVQIPIQVFNTTASDHQGQLLVRAVGLEGGLGGAIAVPAGARRLEIAALGAASPGWGSVEVSLEGADRVIRELEVLPRGHKVTAARAGVLGASTEVALASPEGSEYARVRLVLYPGPLGVLRDALSGAAGRLGSVEDRIFAVALSARGGRVLQALGAAPDPQALRRVRVLATQGLIGEITSDDLLRQLTLLEGSSAAAAEDPVIERLTSWARDELSAAQLPDGTWPLDGGATVQRMLVLTAWAVDVLDDDRASVVAEGAFERQAAFLLKDSTTDAYTAAMVLASGACPGALTAALQAVVAGALERGPDGLWTVALPAGVVRPDGLPVSQVERLAVAARVIDDPERSRDLLGSLVARYDPERGFGDVRSGLAALAAFEALAEAPPSGGLQISLTMDGQPVGGRALNPLAEETLVIAAPVPPGAHRFAVVSDGAWPGLAWNLALESWAPWGDGVSAGGLEVQVLHSAPRAFEPLTVQVIASGPRGAWVELAQQLPAGLSVDTGSLPDGASADDRAVRARIQVGQDGLARLDYAATPGFAGALWSGATTVRAGGELAFSPPELWQIR